MGVCQADFGYCLCPAGWTGDGCTERLLRPCVKKCVISKLMLIIMGLQSIMAARLLTHRCARGISPCACDFHRGTSMLSLRFSEARRASPRRWTGTEAMFDLHPGLTLTSVV